LQIIHDLGYLCPFFQVLAPVIGLTVVAGRIIGNGSLAQLIVYLMHAEPEEMKKEIGFGILHRFALNDCCGGFLR
jgi:hypothetical protein